jgi:hypothetical protein
MAYARQPRNRRIGVQSEIEPIPDKVFGKRLVGLPGSDLRAGAGGL